MTQNDSYENAIQCHHNNTRSQENLWSFFQLIHPTYTHTHTNINQPQNYILLIWQLHINAHSDFIYCTNQHWRVWLLINDILFYRTDGNQRLATTSDALVLWYKYVQRRKIIFSFRSLRATLNMHDAKLWMFKVCVFHCEKEKCFAQTFATC